MPSVGYSLTQRRRVARGWAELAGNHVMIQTPEDQLVAACHLQRGSMRVQPGDDVQPAQTLGRCGNSGNGTGPHVHLQAINRVDVMHAIEVPVTFGVRLPRNREVISTQV